MINNETIETILQKRRSCRSFLSKPVGNEEIETIVEAAKFAPTGMGLQPWHFTVIKNQGIITALAQAVCDAYEKDDKKIKDPETIFYGAPLIILASGSDFSNLSLQDCVLATENMYLAAASMGIGSVWFNYLVRNFFNRPESKFFKDKFIPEDYTLHSASLFGYPKEYSANRELRKEGTVTII